MATETYLFLFPHSTHWIWSYFINFFGMPSSDGFPFEQTFSKIWKYFFLVKVEAVIKFPSILPLPTPKPLYHQSPLPPSIFPPKFAPLNICFFTITLINACVYLLIVVFWKNKYSSRYSHSKLCPPANFSLIIPYTTFTMPFWHAIFRWFPFWANF